MKHFDPAQPTEHEPDVNGFMQDVIGLVQAITVKVFLQPTTSSTPILKLCIGLFSYVSHHGQIVMGHPALTTNHVARVQLVQLV